MNMRFLILLLCLLFTAVNTYAQFLNIEIPIQTETSANTEQKLTFDVYQSASGMHMISIEGENSGVYSISAYRNQLIGVRIPKRTFLYHTALTDSLIFNIQAAYGNSGRRSANLSKPFNMRMRVFKVYNGIKEGLFWQKAYIYLFGSLKIGDVSPGVYVGKIEITIHYW